MVNNKRAIKMQSDFEDILNRIGGYVDELIYQDDGGIDELLNDISDICTQNTHDQEKNETTIRMQSDFQDILIKISDYVEVLDCNDNIGQLLDDIASICTQNTHGYDEDADTWIE